jgi:hypothetical protein
MKKYNVFLITALIHAFYNLKIFFINNFCFKESGTALLATARLLPVWFSYHIFDYLYILRGSRSFLSAVAAFIFFPDTKR